MNILEFRVALTAADFATLRAFYQQSFGLPTALEWDNPDGRGIVLEVGRATLEIIDPAQAETIDAVEAGARVSGQVRFAIEVPNVANAAAVLQQHGATVVNEPVKTPWGDYNQRLQAPDGMQITLFETEES